MPIQAVEKTPSSDSVSPQASAADETLRVNVELLETLMNLAGELVLSRNQLRAAVDQNNTQALTTANQRINQVTSELQDVIMQTRLQPIGTVFSKFPRVVRDMSITLGKDIQVDIQGKDVALDKSLIEGLSDPLTHMVRNAVDHGIESAEERLRAGKKQRGSLRIEARHEAGHVVVEIEDDGKGIDPRRVAQAAISKRLVTSEKILAMSDRDKLSLIFLPGLSTVQKVSDISGRGVGMDVVKTNLDRIGGKVEITSEIGKGTLFSIKLPLTLAIIPSLIVSVEEERFAIPQINIEELLHLRAEDVKRRIEVVGSSEVLLLRDRILPLVRFDQVLGITPTYMDPATGHREIDRRVNLADRRSPRHGLTGDDGTPQAGASEADIAMRRRTDGRRQSAASSIEIAIVTTGTMSYGLVVGEFHDTEEIVVKPLGRQFKSLREYAGATILGDGMVALILDIPGLAMKAELTSLSGTTRAADLAQEAERERLQDSHALLLFHNAPDEVCALPLESVQRLERITPLQLEQAGGRRTMQYRGVSLPLVTLSDAARVKYIDEATELAVLVCNVHGRDVGLLGTRPVDVIETRALIDQATHRQTGIAGSAIINERTTLIVDLFELIDSLYPEWAAARAVQHPVQAGSESITVLLAEDSDFFRAQVKRFLEEDGLAVLDAPDGEAAWELLVENLGRVCIVVTDIEMPLLNGIGLARRIRADDRTSRLPIIAVTSLAGAEEVATGKAAGIDDYQIKLDRDQLLASVHSFIASG
jgi:two-component system chemotaxis sensor kinase CheA